MSFRSKGPERRAPLKKGIDAEETRRRREDLSVQLRKDKRDENLQKKRAVKGGPGTELETFDPAAQASADARSAQVRQEIVERLRQLPQLVEAVHSPDTARQLEAVIAFRKLLSIEKNPPIDEVIASGVVPRLVQFLMAADNPPLQFEAAWALTNVASGTTKHTQKVIECGAVDIFVLLLSSPNEDVREQAVWALGNIAGDSHVCRDLVLQKGALQPLLKLCDVNGRLTMLKNATWTLSNFCRGKPQPAFELVSPALHVLAHIINNSEDAEVLTDACWALSYLSDDTGPSNTKIQAVIQAGVTRKLVQLLMHNSANVKTPALRTVGNIVTGDDQQTQEILRMSALPCLKALLDNPKKGIRKESCCTLDTQLLTNFGFLWFDEVKKLMSQADAGGLLFAAYSQETDAIEYRPAIKLIELQVVDEDIVHFVDSAEAMRWTEESDEYGRNAAKGQQDRSTGLSLSVTADHVMYARIGKRARGHYMINWKLPYAARTAESLLSTDPLYTVGFRTSATAGVDLTSTVGKDALAVSMTGSHAAKVDSFPPAIASALGLNTEDKVDAFLEFYGYWLADGTMLYNKSVTYVRAGPVKSSDKAWLHKVLAKCGLKLGVTYLLCADQESGQQSFLVKHPGWVALFDEEYGHKYLYSGEPMDKAERDSATPDQPEPEEAASAKWAAYWVWQLSAHQVRLIIKGVHLGDGDCTRTAIYTSSVRFRDELVRLLLHAGYSPYFTVRYTKGTVRGYKSYVEVDGARKAVYSATASAGATPITASADGWMVTWKDQRGANISMPSGDITTEKYSGIVWCVDVPPHHRIIARRAEEVNGVVTKASRPVIIGNCWTISNITAGNTYQIQQVIDAGILGPLISILEKEDFDIRKASQHTHTHTHAHTRVGARARAYDSLCCVSPYCCQLTSVCVCVPAYEGGGVGHLQRHQRRRPRTDTTTGGGGRHQAAV